ncbi:MAG: hypothetical protein ACW99L_06605 [Promethearchaeota archaeon]|jgi:hypothetical protein
MPRIPYDHFGLLIFGQGLWKESFTKKISKDTRVSFFHLSGYSKDSLFCTCPICNALVKLFNPMDSDEYIDICDFCLPLYRKLDQLKGQNEGLIFLSHNSIKDSELLLNLANGLLSDEKIKKMYVVETQFKKIPKPIPDMVEELGHQRLSKSKFVKLLENNQYEYSNIYEVYKDKYY